MIHTHPIKTDTEIEKAVAAGVTTFVVDNVDELWKLIPYQLDSGDVDVIYCP